MNEKHLQKPLIIGQRTTISVMVGNVKKKKPPCQPTPIMDALARARQLFIPSE